ncbi:snoaL-like domain protein [Collimonas arenae]|uniref:nuclear transport factor 2 family protein n=1 Tax=Collimonas arenae TaxID=279058 RepID=UPI000778861E|nr:nuclear transport factor 2 family protein [Collimonas arenae]AMP00621.1 snoaL-like domain protein [Collimonas arenae]
MFSPACGRHRLLVALANQSGATNAQSDESSSALTQAIAAMDARLFDAYNRCDLEQFSEYFTPDVEFYHDQGGVTWNRDEVVENTRKYICHKVRRELLPGTLQVYPIKDYGAIEEGEHRFCSVDTGKCEGVAKFLMIWENKDGKWRMTRVVSYGHRALSASENAAPH